MRTAKTTLLITLLLALASISFLPPAYAQESHRIPKADYAILPSATQLRPLTRNGKPFFPIGAYGIPADCTIPELHDAGWNTLLLILGEANLAQELDECAVSGISVITNMTVPVYANDREQVASFINQYKSYPAMLGYYIADEPENHYYNSDQFAQAQAEQPGLSLYDFIVDTLSWVPATVNELDPNRYTFMCAAWWTAYSTLQSLCDVNMPDEYPTNGTTHEFEGDQAAILYDARMAADAARQYGGL